GRRDAEGTRDRSAQPACGLVSTGRVDACHLPGPEQVLRGGRPRHRCQWSGLGRGLGPHRQELNRQELSQRGLNQQELCSSLEKQKAATWPPFTLCPGTDRNIG